MKSQAITYLLISAVLLILFSFTPDNKKRELTESVLHKNERNNTFFVVVKVKNKNTGKTKEICTTVAFLQGAIEQETDSNISADSIQYKYPDLCFEFSNPGALDNISFGEYTSDQLDSFQNTLNIKRIIRQVKKGKLNSKFFGLSGKDSLAFLRSRTEQKMFAHILFNNGILCRQGQCYNSSTLYFENFDLNKQ